jgi:hypothetical protein
MSFSKVYQRCILIIYILDIATATGANSIAGTVVALSYMLSKPNTRIRNFKVLDGNCEFFNNCNAIDNCMPESEIVTTTATQSSVTQTGTVTITTIAAFAVLTTINVDTVTVTTFNDITQT